MAWDLRVDELHPKKLIINEFQQGLDFFNAQFHGKLLHVDLL